MTDIYAELFSGLFSCGTRSLSCTQGSCDPSDTYSVASGELINNDVLQSVVQSIAAVSPTNSPTGTGTSAQGTVTVTQSAATVTVTAGGSGAGGSKISIGAAAGAGIGAGLGVMLLVGAALWFFRPGKGSKSQKHQAVAPSSYTQDHKPQTNYSAQHAPTPELPSTTGRYQPAAHELS